MIPGAPKQARWTRSEPRRTWPVPAFERVVQRVFPGRRLLEVQPFTDGFRNANFKLRLDCRPELVVLRLYEQDPALCQKEIDLLRLVGDSGPAPEVLYAEPEGREDFGPFMVMGYVEGISFHELRRSGDREAIAQAAFSAGEALAAIGRHTFSKPGWLAAGPSVTAPLLEGADPMPRFIDLCLASEKLQDRVDADLRGKVHGLVWEWAAPLAAQGEATRLVHGDFNQRNLLVREVAGRWVVAGVLDWEFAVSGTSLADLGNFLRHEAAQPGCEPHFAAGYLNAGGALPTDWRYLAKMVDLTAVCERLTHGHLPGPDAGELVEVLRAL